MRLKISNEEIWIESQSVKPIFIFVVKSAEASGPSSSQWLRWRNQDTGLLNNLTKGTEEYCAVYINIEVKRLYKGLSFPFIIKMGSEKLISLMQNRKIK